MNREIKFRGRAAQGKWLYGDLEYKRAAGVAIIHSYKEDGTYNRQEQVNESTVGQFTGLHDKNGKEIYEGDILRVPRTETNAEIISIVVYDADGFMVRSRYDSWGNTLAWCVRERVPEIHKGEVIGNIHDTPELLKGGEL